MVAALAAATALPATGGAQIVAREAVTATTARLADPPTTPRPATGSHPGDRPTHDPPEQSAHDPAGAQPAPAAAPVDPAAGAEDDVHGTSNDLLADNGLRSPWCAPGRQTNPAARRNCQHAGLASTGAGGDDAGFDRHVDTSSWTGAPKIDRWFISIVLSVLSLIWTVMLTATRGVLAALEFALGFNPLDAAHRGTWVAQLEVQVHAVTGPLAMVLAPVGAIWIAWTAAATQRPGHAIRHAIYTGLILTGCLLVLANPITTIGALLTASQRAGIAVIAITAGQPGQGDTAAQAGLQAMADGVIDQPLALLEFGDTAWGTNPHRLDPKLHAAALALARKDSPAAVAAVRAATSNLDLFEVWPANSPQRNSINDPHSLLRVLCASDDASDCHGPNADRAEFRSERGAWQRALGLVVILLGLIPFWIAVGLCAAKIIAASLLSIIRLIQLTFLTPIALIGEQGTQRLTSFAGQWAGNILAAATYSFFLGLVMLIWRLISSWPGYGFVTQWLLLMIALWQLIAHRHSLWGTVNAPQAAAMGAGGYLARYTAMTIGARGTLAATRTAQTGARQVGRAATLPWQAGTRAARTARAGWDRWGALTPPPSATTARATTATAGPGTVGATLPAERSGAQIAGAAGELVVVPNRQRVQGARRALAAQNQRVAAAAATQRAQLLDSTDLPGLRLRRARINGQLSAIQEALPAASAHRRKRLLMRRASLTARQQHIDAQTRALSVAQHATRSATDDPRKDLGIRARWIDQQARLPRGEPGAGPRRDYPRLAALIDGTPGQYRAASPQQRLQARARIDRELARRSSYRATLTAATTTPAPAPDTAGQRPDQVRPPRRTPRRPADGREDER